MKLKLPIDVPALFKTATELQELAKVPLGIAIYLDDTAPAPLIAHVRSVLSAESPNLRLTVDYLSEGEKPQVKSDNDMAVIVAGDMPGIGQVAEHIRQEGIPVAVVTMEPDQVGEKATAEGHPIPDGDLVYPADLKYQEESGDLRQ